MWAVVGIGIAVVVAVVVVVVVVDPEENIQYPSDSYRS